MRRRKIWISLLAVALTGAALLTGLLYLEHKDTADFADKEPSAQDKTESFTSGSVGSETEVEDTAQNDVVQDTDQSDPDTEEMESVTELIFAGDVCLSGYVTANYDKAGISGVLEDGLLLTMQQADICMVNEEFPFGTGGTQAEDKQYTFRTDPSYSSIFTDMGVDIVTLANNHVLDYGQEVLRQTFQTLDEKGILYAGAGESVEEASALRTIEANGETYGFLAASRVIPVTSWNVENSQPGVFTTYDKTALVHAIERAKDNCDFLTVYVHWGIERNTMPEDYQIELAHAYIDAGADLVIGAHPHVLQGIEEYQGKMIFYSLGNFIFNQSIEKTMLVRVTKENGQTRYSILPAFAAGAKTQPYTDTESFYRYLESISFGISVTDGVVGVK